MKLRCILSGIYIIFTSNIIRYDKFEHLRSLFIAVWLASNCPILITFICPYLAIIEKSVNHLLNKTTPGQQQQRITPLCLQKRYLLLKLSSVAHEIVSTYTHTRSALDHSQTEQRDSRIVCQIQLARQSGQVGSLYRKCIRRDDRKDGPLDRFAPLSTADILSHHLQTQ